MKFWARLFQRRGHQSKLISSFIKKFKSKKITRKLIEPSIKVRHDKKNLPKEIIVEAKNESGHRQFKYDLKHSYFSQRKQCFSFYMNCCTYDGCPARIVVDEEYEEKVEKL